MDDKTYDPIPDELRSEAEEGSGPCRAQKGAGHITVETNMLGRIELHKCDCSSVFTYSTTYGWLWITRGSELRKRIVQEVKTARDAGAPGWANAYYTG